MEYCQGEILHSPEFSPPWQLSAQAGGELDGITPKTFRESVKQARIGANYLRDREKIEKDYKAKYKKLAEVKESGSFREQKKKSRQK